MKQTSEESDQQKQSLNNQFSWRQIVLAFGIFFIGTAFGFGLQDSSLLDRPTTTQNQELPSRLDYSSVDEVYDSLRENFDGELSVDELLDGLKRGLAQATGDPYTEYLSVEASQDFDDDLSGTFSGIGAELGREDENIIIVAPLSGFPAEDAGLQSRDVILQVDGESVTGKSITEVVQMIRGEVGTDVTLTIARDFERLEITITRETITIPSVEFEILDGNIGYLDVSRFGEDTVQLVRRAYQDFMTVGVDGIVLDMRTNPGGLLNASVELADLWLPRGAVIVEERRGDEVIRTFDSRSDPLIDGIPTIVLVNEASASASEIVAGALSDNGVATIIGQTTFGKGSVQQLDRLRSGGTLKVTIARWYTPEGLNIDREGIEPEISVERTREDFEADRDPQLDRAVEELTR